jgi:hypothetical protein
MRAILIASAAVIALSLPTSAKLTYCSAAMPRTARKKAGPNDLEIRPPGKKFRRASVTYEEFLERKRTRGSRRGLSCINPLLDR